MSSYLLNVPQLFQLMLEIDQELAEAVRAQCCPHCGGVLHCADFARKPRGCPKRFVEAYSSRASYTCYRCKQRTTPPSVRYLGRRLYLAVVLVLVSSRRESQLPWLSRALGVSSRTVDRWRSWWRETFVDTRLWQSIRSQFVPGVDTQTLPAGVLERLEAPSRIQRLLRFLRLISPLSTASILHMSA